MTADITEEATDRDASASQLPALLAVPSIAILQIGLAISLAALIFAGPLADGVGRAASGFLLGTAVVLIVLGLTSSMDCVIGGAQDTAAIIAAAVATSIAVELSSTAAVSTVIIMLALSAALTGVGMWVIGHFKLGSFVRVLPASVVSGFMAGTGWLLMRGGVEVMLGRAVHLGDVPGLFEWSTLRYLVLGLAIGAFMVLAARLPNSGIVVSAMLAATAIGFHVVGRSVSSLQGLEDGGWLIGPLPEDAQWTPLTPTDFAEADWGVLGSHMVGIVAIAAVSIIGLLLNLGGMEAVTGDEIDLDHEFRIAGPANVAVAGVGGLIGYHLIGDSLLARQLGVRSKVTTLAVGGLALLAFIGGFDLVGLMPRAVAGGVLIGLGLGLAATWVAGLRSSTDFMESAVSVLILVAIAGLGVLPGVGIGLIVAALIFVYRYSRIDPVRHRVDAAGHSNVDRTASDRRTLLVDPRRITALELQGYLFFGSVMRLRTHFEREVAHTREIEDVTWLIIDCARVTGVDTTAMGTFGAMIKRLGDENVEAVWSGLDTHLAQTLIGAQVNLASVQPDLDHAIAYAEDQLLTRSREPGDRPELDLRSTVSFVPAGSGYPEGLEPLLEPKFIPAGTTVVEVGDGGRDLYVVVSGRLTAWTTLEDGSRRRLRQIGEESLIGELAFATGEPRTATVVADTDAALKVLSRERFDRLASDQPDLALEIQQWMLSRLSGRLAATSAMVRQLMR